MNPIFNFARDLPGKVFTKQMATLDLSIQFGLWKDYIEWVDPSKQLDFWYPTDILKSSNVTLEIILDDEIILTQKLMDFREFNIHHSFVDEGPGCCDLRIKISHLDGLPIRDNTGSFVCGMFKISKFKLQGIDVEHLLENTLFGKDIETTIFQIPKPVYPWMIENVKLILPGVFDCWIIEDSN